MNLFAVISAWNCSPFFCIVSYVSFSRLMAIQQCDLVLVHIYPQGEDTLVSDRPKKEVGSFQSNDNNNKKLQSLCSNSWDHVTHVTPVTPVTPHLSSSTWRHRCPPC